MQERKFEASQTCSTAERLELRRQLHKYRCMEHQICSSGTLPSMVSPCYVRKFSSHRCLLHSDLWDETLRSATRRIPLPVRNTLARTGSLSLEGRWACWEHLRVTRTPPACLRRTKPKRSDTMALVSGAPRRCCAASDSDRVVMACCVHSDVNSRGHLQVPGAEVVSLLQNTGA